MTDENCLTEEQIILIKEAFSMFDKDEEITNILNEYDLDGDGIIDYGEFLTMMQRTSKIKETEQDQRLAFRVFDKDDDGNICLDEIRFILNHLSETNPEEIEECLQFYDTENNGKINFKNYMALMKPRDF